MHYIHNVWYNNNNNNGNSNIIWDTTECVTIVLIVSMVGIGSREQTTLKQRDSGIKYYYVHLLENCARILMNIFLFSRLLVSCNGDILCNTKQCLNLIKLDASIALPSFVNYPRLYNIPQSNKTQANN